MKHLTILLIILCTSFTVQSQLEWYPQNSGTNVVLFDIDFNNHYLGWACGNSGTILHTDDGGDNWFEQDPPPNNTYYGISFPSATIGFACGYGGQIIHTSNGGNLWEEQQSNTTTYLYDIHFVDEHTGWIVGGDNGTFPSYISYRIILHTNDGGSTWVKQVDASGEKPLMSVFFINDSTGYAVGEGGEILHTDDAGITWSRQAIYSSNHFTSVFFVDENIGWVVGQYLGLPHSAVITITNDGGENWIEHFLMEGFGPSDIYFHDEFNGWMVGGGGALPIYYTHDRGYTWFPDDPGVFEFLYAIDFVDESTGWACGNLGTIISSATAVSNDDSYITSSVLIYPNPASDAFIIKQESSSEWNPDMYMLNSGGQIVFSAAGILPAGTSKYKMDIQSFEEGIYILVIEDQNIRKTEKILVIH